MRSFLQGLFASLLSDKAPPHRKTAEGEALPIRKIPDLLPEPILLADKFGDIAWANRAAQRQFSLSAMKRWNLFGINRDPELIAAMEKDEAVWVELGFINQAYFFVYAVPLGKQKLLIFRDMAEAKNIDRMRRDFIANISHEFKTPLMSLGGSLETLQSSARQDPIAQEKFLAIMAKQISRMQRLVTDLLSLSHIEMAEHLPIKGEVNLRNLVELAIENLPEGFQIQVIWADDVPSDIPGEEEELSKVIRNLLDNAIHYAKPPFEIQAKMVNDPTGATRYGENTASMVALSFKDQGLGITKEHIPRLTERFYRVDPARSQEVGGTGLGLAIVKHILHRHRGSLVIESEWGKGSTFICYLPCHKNVT